MRTERPKGKVAYQNQGRVILVTGGSNGIGRAICEAFSESGATVVNADIVLMTNGPEMEDKGHSATVHAGPTIAENTCFGNEQRSHGEIHFVQTDVSRESECKRVVDWTVDRFGAIDVLVNNAAIQPPTSYLRVDQIEDSDYQKMLGVNLTGYFYMAKHGLGVMREQQSGVVINMASGQGHRTARHVPVYGPIKAANLLQAMQWGIEYARDGIRVVSVSPGAIDTPLVRASLAAQGGPEKLANRHPIGRIGRPEEIANAVLWLSSSDASFVTATDLTVDGGLQAFGAFAEPY